MTLEQKVKILENYVAPDMYTKGSYIDAMDTTQVYIMAKIIASSNNEVTVNFDGWSEKHDYVRKSPPFRANHPNLVFVLFCLGFQKEILQDRTIPILTPGLFWSDQGSHSG